ncbi:MAG: AsnC family transcriptional regulator [Pseudomonadota bacterium]|nr:AsnC family transcriptional regulator [Pseudomonadota bacterium]
MDDLDRRIVNRLQGGFPLSDRPYREVAESLDATEAEVIECLQKLLDTGVLSRFGPMYHAEKMGGGLSLCAMSVPEEAFDETADKVNVFPQVAHNYARDHKLNMWFVLATESPAEIPASIEMIERATGFRVYDMPKLDEYFIGLRLEA